MTSPTRADGNQAQIVDDLRALGYRVFVTSMVRHGFPDLVVSKWGRALLVEVKRPGGKLTDNERRFADEWGDVVIVAHTSEDVAQEFEDGIHDKEEAKCSELPY